MFLDARALKRLRGERRRGPAQKHRQRSADRASIQATRKKFASGTIACHDS
jgi:hypothetical protein